LFAFFMRFLAAPTPSANTPGGSASIQRGLTNFNNVGCNLCHIQNQKTHTMKATELTNITFSPFSDFAIHNMGPGLADGISQGAAAGDEFRTAPLWGLGQRIFFLHDGRTKDLLQAIAAHKSAAANGIAASEATTVINRFNALGAGAKQDLLNFLRS